jgi:hypothetical protein
VVIKHQSLRAEIDIPLIVVEDPKDTAATKRTSNTLAARKARERKMKKLDELEEQISKLEAEREHWREFALRRTEPTKADQVPLKKLYTHLIRTPSKAS